MAATTANATRVGAEEFGCRFRGGARPHIVGDATKGIPVGAFSASLKDVMAIRRALYSMRGSNDEKLIKKGGVVKLGPSEDDYEVHLSVSGATIMDDALMLGTSAPWPEIAELLEQGRIKWNSGARPLSRTQRAEYADLGDASFTFCELFAGIGGFRLGLEALNGRCVFASEINAGAVATYVLNFNDVPAGDITEVPTCDIPDHDILTAGFPCQPFTNIGEKNGLSDPRGQLYREICRVLNAKRPSAFLLENVKNLFNVDGGRGHADFNMREPGTAFLTILYSLEVECGYRVFYDLISSEPWVPQSRERLYIVGFRDDLPEAASRFRWPTPPQGPARVVRDFLEEPTSEAVRAAELTISQWTQLQRSTTFREKESSRYVHLDRPSRTIVSSYKSGSAYYAEVINEERDGARRDGQMRPRFFTARECCRAMGFPESYQIPGNPVATKGQEFQSHHQFFHQIGNAVCAPVITAIGSEILSALRTC